MQGGETEGHPNKKKEPVSGREEGTLDTLIRLERGWGRQVWGRGEMKGGKKKIRYWPGVHLSILLLTKCKGRSNAKLITM